MENDDKIKIKTTLVYYLMCKDNYLIEFASSLIAYNIYYLYSVLNVSYTVSYIQRIKHGYSKLLLPWFPVLNQNRIRSFDK